MEEELFSRICWDLMEGSGTTKSGACDGFALQKRSGSSIWYDLMSESGKVIVSAPDVTRTILASHRRKGICHSLLDTVDAIKRRYEVSPMHDQGIPIAAIKATIASCPFCEIKQYEQEKPMLVRWSNGLVYKCYVLATHQNLCCVEMDDYSTAVLHMKDVFNEFEHEVMCCVCNVDSSDPPNEIVLCDCCNTGYHQKCHKPVVTEGILQSDCDWFCRQCQGSKDRGSAEEIPPLNFSTLACLAILDLGPSSKTDIISWVQERFVGYAELRNDKWKTRLEWAMCVTKHWLYRGEEGKWSICTENSHLVTRHVRTLPRKYVPPSLLESLPALAHGSSDKRGKENNKPNDLITSPSNSIKLQTPNEKDVSSPVSDLLTIPLRDTSTWGPRALSWDAQHRTNAEGVYCYCGGGGFWWKTMLQCQTCRQWFHQACVTCLPRALLWGEAATFHCSSCNFGEEYVRMSEWDFSQALHLAMYHVVQTRYHGDFSLPVCLKLNVLPLLRKLDSNRYADTQVREVAEVARQNKKLFEVGAKHKNTTLYRLVSTDPPKFEEESGVSPSLPASPQSNPAYRPPSLQTTPGYLPPGFIVHLSNGSAGLQVDGSPPVEHYPPSRYEVSIFKGLNYYSDRAKKRPNKLVEEFKKSTSQPASKVAKVMSDVQIPRGRPEEKSQARKKNKECILSEFALKRVGSGEKYRILGKRQAPDNSVEYFIAWEGVSPCPS